MFVSYSWTTPDHEAWVLKLGSDLRASGIDVILDKWDLKEGHDAHAFMEKMVTDPNIKKVILVCDKAYAEKTDGRMGGVGTEAQIISSEIYTKQDQNKFVAIVKERGDDGRPYLPVYYRSRIYIDLSDPGTFSENFDQLLRWAFDQPLYKKPELGSKPTFLSIELTGGVALTTSSRFRRALEAIRNNRDNAIPAAGEYFDQLASELEKLRVDSKADPYDDAVVQSIESFLPYRNEAVEIFINLANYIDTPASRNLLHRFFERLIPYLDMPENVSAFREWDSDNFRFIVHELFLYSVASSIRFERFESVAHLLQTPYYVPRRSRYGDDVMVSFGYIRRHLKSFEYRNNRLHLNRLSLRADVLKTRCQGTGIEFRDLMQADFLLYIRSLFVESPYWWPETLVHIHDQSAPFEVFARSQSLKFFNKVTVMLETTGTGSNAKEKIAAALKLIEENPNLSPRWQYESFNSAYLLGFSKLATMP